MKETQWTEFSDTTPEVSSRQKEPDTWYSITAFVFVYPANFWIRNWSHVTIQFVVFVLELLGGSLQKSMANLPIFGQGTDSMSLLILFLCYCVVLFKKKSMAPSISRQIIMKVGRIVLLVNKHWLMQMNLPNS